MTLLIAGLLLFAITHLFPSVFAGTRDELVVRLGRNTYRGLYSIVITASLVLTIVGWRSMMPINGYIPPFKGGLMMALVILAAFILFVASQTPNNIRRHVRHPQMMAVILWSLAHLHVNGDPRSIVLFGGLGVWAVLEIFFCNRRDGEWQKPDAAPRKWDAITVAIGAAGFVVIFLVHRALFGVPPYTA